MAKKQREEEGGGSWMDTYGDMVTLLLTFFVMLYSMSTIIDDKWVQLVSAFKIEGEEKTDQLVFVETDGELGQAGGDGALSGVFNDDEDPYKGTQFNAAIEELYDKIKSYLEDAEMANSILMDVSEDVSEEELDENGSGEEPKNMFLQFKDNVLFNPDESTIRPESEEVLKYFGDCLAEVKDDIALIIIKGHTAKSPNSLVDSRLLSTERAGNISNFFEHECGIPSDMLVPIGHGSNYPIADNDTEEGRTKNRRVEIVIVNKNSDLGKNSEFLKTLGASFEGDVSYVLGDTN